MPRKKLKRDKKIMNKELEHKWKTTLKRVYKIKKKKKKRDKPSITS